MIELEFKSSAIEDALAHSAASIDDKSKLMNQIGAQLVRSAKDRAIAGVDVNGAPFIGRSQATLDRYAAEGISHISTLRQSGEMVSQIFHSYDAQETEVGSNAVQAAMMQFGGSKSTYPHLWGDIPARAFLGISQQDEVDIYEIIGEWLEELGAER